MYKIFQFYKCFLLQKSKYCTQKINVMDLATFEWKTLDTQKKFKRPTSGTKWTKNYFKLFIFAIQMNIKFKNKHSMTTGISKELKFRHVWSGYRSNQVSFRRTFHQAKSARMKLIRIYLRYYPPGNLISEKLINGFHIFGFFHFESRYGTGLS